MSRLHQLHSSMSRSLDNVQNSTGTAFDHRRRDGVGDSISDDTCSESTNYDPNDVNLSTYDLYTETELSIIDETSNFLVPSAERLKEIKSDAIQRMTAASEEMQPCCICGLSYNKEDVTQKEITDEFIQRLKVCITVPRDVPAVVAAQYSASRFDLRLQGLLLFPPAIMKSENGVWCQVCRMCDECITGGKEPKLPVNAIANGNYIGWLPRRFSALTRTDEQAVALVLPCVSLSVVTGGPCRTIKSHHCVVRNTEGPVTEMLPRDLSCRVRVTMVGHMTSDQVIACKRRYQLNLPLCRAFLKFLYLHNQEYKTYQQTTITVMRGVSRTRTKVINLNGGLSSHGRTMGRENDGGDRSIDQFLNSSCDDAGVIVDRTSVYEEKDSTSDVVQNIRDQSTYSTFGSTVEEGADNSVEDAWIDASSVLQSQSAQHFVDVVVRKSNDYVPASKWAGCLKMFPTLFPAGVGGPLESRKHHMSVRQWILRCLRIHGHRFEKHYAFMLLAFDYLASEKARQTLFVKMNVKQNALRAAEIKQSTVLEAVRYFRHLSECRAKGMRPKPPNEEVQRVVDLRKGIRVPETAFYGSNLGRLRARFDLFGMLKRFGPLQLFFTISPDTDGTYSIAVKSGELSDKAIKEANLLLLPKRAERKQIAASYPVECARYFLRVVDTVIESFLGWDRLHSAPKKGGGLFGITRAFGASAETQVAGDLHAHFAVWLHGFPTTSSEFITALVYDKSFQSRLLQLVDSTLSSKPPCLVEEQKCVSCSAEGMLRTVVPGVDAYRRPAAGALPPTTSLCTACGAKFKDKDIIDASLLSLAGDKYDTTNSQWKDYEKCRALHNSVGNDIATSLLVRDLQVHYWNHCKTCFKKTIRTPRASVCRFLKPEPVHLGCTTIDEKQSLRIHRPIGCEYVNAYNTVVMDTIKCNHDAQFVFNNGSKATAAYVVKYCFKAQNPVENQMALSLAAFTKAAAKTNALPPDTSALERGYKLFGSMLYTITNGQEVAAPMAALYILNETPFWFSHEFVRVDLWKLIQKQNDSVEISVSQQQIDDRRPSQNSILSVNVLERYLKRATTLENVSFIEILEQFEFVKTKTKKKSNS